MAVVLTNNATSLLAGAIDAGATTLSVLTADAGRFPNPAAGDWFPLTLVDNAGNMEIVKATAREGAIISVQRAQEGTTAIAFPAGARVDLRATAAALIDVGEKATTKTVGAAMAGANGKETPADGDSFAGVEAGGSTMFKTTWGNIKLWLRDFFDARFVRKDAPEFSAYKMETTISSFCYMFWRSPHVAFVKKTGGYNFYWRRNDTGTEGGANQQDLMTLDDRGTLKVNGVHVGNTVIQKDGNINGAAFDGYLTTFIFNESQARANAAAATKTAPQNCSWSTGIMEFGSVDPGHNNETADLPSPWVMVGIRSVSNSDRVYVRGTTLKNTA